MAVINILSPLVADMIAAGEVVERPGSVVKELLENAVDAGAKNITVELRGGGTTYIRITDDGCGMEPDDAGNCFLRHATSKLKDARGLEAIGTLGFRGEALAAISAVSRIELLTRPKGAPEGTRVLVEGGEIREMGPWGCPEGTSFIVRDLFFNTPARLKFMKSDRAEGSHCVQLAQKVALGHPEVSVRCLHDGKEDFFTAGDGRQQSAVYSIFGRDMAMNMLECRGGGLEVDVTGYVSSPAAGRGNRAMQFFFVNGRAIKSLTLQAAVEQAYKNTLLVGRYPACALYISLSPGLVDVNVHPTKNEVKFSQEGRVFDAVYHSVKNALEAERPTAGIHLSASTEKKLAADILHKPRPVSPDRARPVMGRTDPPPLFRATLHTAPAKAPAAPVPAAPVLHSPAPVYEKSRTVMVPAPGRMPEEKPAPERSVPMKETPWVQNPWRLLGEVMNTYIVAETDEGMLLIDKHAAHERAIFDRLKARGGQSMSQGLLLPVTWRPDGESRDVAEAHRQLLEELGFELEAYGQEDMILRAVPADIDAADGPAALEEICEKLKKGGTDLGRDEVLHTIACKAAIKAGRSSDPRELMALAERVIAGELRYCPHGRPVATLITKTELDKRFKRIV